MRGVFLVEVTGGFVREHARGPRDQRARDRAALALAAGKLAGLVPRALAQTHAPEQFLAARCVASPIGVPRINSGIATFSIAVNSGSR